MRLVGATPGQVSVLGATAASVVAGTARGFALFFALRPALAHVSLTGEPFASGDLSLGPADILLVAVGYPGSGVGPHRAAAVRLSPLGVTRRATPPWWVIPLLAGLGWLAAERSIRHSLGADGKTLAYLAATEASCTAIVATCPQVTGILLCISS